MRATTMRAVTNAMTRPRAVHRDENARRRRGRSARVGIVTARSSSSSNFEENRPTIDRREAMLAMSAMAAMLMTKGEIARAEGIVNPQPIDNGWMRFYGEATSSSSYGGYGGNENNFDKFKYFYEIPSGWEQDTVNKVEKSTNGTDNRWKSKSVKGANVYCVTLPGYAKLKDDREAIISDLALSDYNLQDAIIAADSFVVNDRDVDGQLYVDYDLVGFFGHIFASITVYAGRLYAVFSVVPDGASDADVAAGLRSRNSFATITRDASTEAADLEFYRRS